MQNELHKIHYNNHITLQHHTLEERNHATFNNSPHRLIYDP